MFGISDKLCSRNNSGIGILETSCLVLIFLLQKFVTLSKSPFFSPLHFFKMHNMKRLELNFATLSPVQSNLHAWDYLFSDPVIIRFCIFVKILRWFTLKFGKHWTEDSLRSLSIVPFNA